MRKVRRPLHKSLLSTRVRRANQDDAHEDEIVQAGGSNEAISVRGRSLNLSIGPQQWRSLRTLTPTSIECVKISCSLDMFIGGSGSDEAILVTVETIKLAYQTTKGLF